MAQRRDGPAIVSLRRLIDDTEKGLYQIPHLQRDFVWDAEQRLDLCDSVNRAIPMGSLMVWRTRDDNTFDTRRQIGPISIPAPEPGRPHDYLIDGLQRLTTLMLALAPRARGVPSTEEDLEDICYDLNDPNPERGSPFRLARRGAELAPSWIPLHLLFDPVRMRDFQLGLLKRRQKEWLEESERLMNRFKDYEIPIVALTTDDLDVVAQTFVRINSSGRRIEELDFLRALLWADDQSLEQRFERALVELEPLGWGNISSDVMLAVLKVLVQGDPYRSQPRELAARFKANPTVLESFPDVLVRTVELLDGFGVRGPAALPYTYQLAALARAIAAHGHEAVMAAAPRLERWFYQTAYAAYFAGITGDGLLRAFEHVQKIVADPDFDTLSEDMNRWVRPATQGILRRNDRARVVLLALLLARESDRRAAAANRKGTTLAPERPHTRLVGEHGGQALCSLAQPYGPRNRGSLVVCTPDVLAALRGLLGGQVLLFPKVRPGDYLISDEMLTLANKEGSRRAFELRRVEIDSLEKRLVESLGLRWADGSEP